MRDAIARHLPAHGSAANPIDVTTDWKRFPAMYRESLRSLLDSEEIDAVVPVLLQRSALDEGVVDAVIQETTRGVGKPVHVCWVAPAQGDALRRKLLANGLPCHEWAARAARVLARCRAIEPDAPPVPGQTLACPEDVPADGWLSADVLFTLLADWGLPVAPWRFVPDAEAAVAAASVLGFPAVLKAVRPNLVHKTEVGAVRLNLLDAAAVRDAFASLVDTLGPGPALVQAQAERGTELVLVALRDPTFGQLVICGLGGIWTEALRDIVIRAAPIDSREAARSFDDLRASSLLDGLRGAPGVDRQALGALVSTLSTSIDRAPWCAELDLNPVIANGKRFVIVDARMRIEGIIP